MNKNKLFTLLLIVLFVFITPYEAETYTVSGSGNALSGFYTWAKSYDPRRAQSKTSMKTISGCSSAGGRCGTKYVRAFKYLAKCQISDNNVMYRDASKWAPVTGYTKYSDSVVGTDKNSAMKSCQSKLFIVRNRTTGYEAKSYLSKDMGTDVINCTDYTHEMYNNHTYLLYGARASKCASDLNDQICECTVDGKDPTQYSKTNMYAYHATISGHDAYCISPGLTFPASGTSYVPVSDSSFDVDGCDKVTASSSRNKKFSCGIAAIVLSARDSGADYASVMMALRLWAVDIDGEKDGDRATSELVITSNIYKTTATAVTSNSYGGNDDSSKSDSNMNLIHATGGALSSLQKAISLYSEARQMNFTFWTPSIKVEDKTYNIDKDGNFEFTIQTNFDKEHTKNISVTSQTSGITLTLEDPNSTGYEILKVKGKVANMKNCYFNSMDFILKYKDDRDVTSAVKVLEASGQGGTYQRFVYFDEEEATKLANKGKEKKFTIKLKCPKQEEKKKFKCDKPNIDYSGQVTSCIAGDNKTVVSAVVEEIKPITTLQEANEYLSQKTNREISYVSPNASKYTEDNLPSSDSIINNGLGASNMTTSASVNCVNLLCTATITNYITSVGGSGKTTNSEGNYYIPVTFTVQFKLKNGKTVSQQYYSVGYSNPKTLNDNITAGGGTYKNSYNITLESLPAEALTAGIASATVTSAKVMTSTSEADKYIQAKINGDMEYASSGSGLSSLPTASEILRSGLGPNNFSTTGGVTCSGKECTITITNTIHSVGGSGKSADNSKSFDNGTKAKNVWYIPVKYTIKYMFYGGQTAEKTYYSVGFGTESGIKSSIQSGGGSYTNKYQVKINQFPEPEKKEGLTKEEKEEQKAKIGTKGVVKDPTINCILNDPILYSNYDFTPHYVNSTSLATNNYCQVKCRETITYKFYGKVSAINVRFIQYTNGTFKYNNLLSTIVGFRECVSDINYDKWKRDYEQANEQVRTTWNTYKMYENLDVITRPYVKRKIIKCSMPRSCAYCCTCGCCSCKNSSCWPCCYRCSGGCSIQKTHLTWPVKYYGYTYESGSVVQAPTSATDGWVSCGGGACSGVYCRGQDGNINKFTAAHNSAKQAYIRAINRREQLISQIQDCNLWANYKLDQFGVDLLQYTRRDNKDSAYYRAVAGYQFDPKFSYEYNSVYSSMIKISESGNTELTYPTNTYNRYTFSPTNTSITYPEGSRYCVNCKEKAEESLGGTKEEKLYYWKCLGKGTGSRCNKLKISVPKNNIAYVKAEKQTHYWQEVPFYATVPEGNIVTGGSNDVLALSDRNIFPLEIDKESGTYDTYSHHKNVGDKLRKNVIKIQEGDYTCTFDVTNEITIDTRQSDQYGFYFRTIDLDNVFPAGKRSAVWSTAQATKLVADIESKGENIYQNYPDYEFIITPANIRAIKNYNRGQESQGGFNDFNLTCECETGICYCKSHFLEDISYGGSYRNLVSSYKRFGIDY